MRYSTRFIETTKRRACGAISLCLLLCLTACGANPLVKSTKTEKERPPQSLVVQSRPAEWPASLTNGELLELAKGYRRQLVECNADKAAIELWSAPAVEPKPEPDKTPGWWSRFFGGNK